MKNPLIQELHDSREELIAKRYPLKAQKSAAPGRDQLEEYAARKGMSLEMAEKWLAPNLEG